MIFVKGCMIQNKIDSNEVHEAMVWDLLSLHRHVIIQKENGS